MPQTYYPQLLASKGMTQLPYTSKQSFETVTVDMDSSQKHAYGRYGTGLSNFPTGPLWSFEHQLNLTNAELATLRSFYDGRSGKLEEFIYLDPSGNLVKYSEDFSVADWEKNNVTVGSAAEDPFGGTRATTLSATSSNSNINATVLPLGDASGFVITGSIYVRPYDAGKSLSIGFIDSGFSVLGSKTVSIPTVWQWYRLTFTYTLATSSYIRLLIGGFGTWNNFDLDVFGAQCVALPAEGGYVKSPEFWGYHPKCRFDQDAIDSRSVAPNQNQVAVSIKEIF